MKLPASRRLGARLDGMVNTCELPINVVTIDELKMLKSSPKKGKWLGSNVVALILRERYVTGEKAEPNPSTLHKWNTVSLYFFLSGKVNRKEI